MSAPQPQLDKEIKQPKSFRRPQKITQLLCFDQNYELKTTFITWLAESFKYLPNILGSVYLELELLINFIEFRFTVSRDKPQVGDYLQNIKYKGLTKKVRLLYLLLDVVGPYLKKRFTLAAEKFIESQMQKIGDKSLSTNQFQRFSPNKNWIVFGLKKVLSAISIFDKIYVLLSFVNLAVFIKNGKYRSLTQRLLKMQMQFVDPLNSRVLDFTLMNRAMIWQIYQMLLKNTLPFLYQLFGSSLKNVFYLHSYLGVQENQNEQICVICGDTPTMIVKAQPCNHLACFYCAKGQQQKAKCNKCEKIVERWEALYGKQ